MIQLKKSSPFKSHKCQNILLLQKTLTNAACEERFQKLKEHFTSTAQVGAKRAGGPAAAHGRFACFWQAATDGA
jgi:hypothetical protein